ncbi:hypothetical protein GCM10025791_22340 [Halioxenophilus aromaticivorans]|uniref:Uncharacterized protein n=1 Tax=Halioxenophilus aromaticivorans TaxID=1306992 RepID=A0AAV3U2J3_9ALTE
MVDSSNGLEWQESLWAIFNELRESALKKFNIQSERWRMAVADGSENSIFEIRPVWKDGALVLLERHSLPSEIERWIDEKVELFEVAEL